MSDAFPPFRKSIKDRCRKWLGEAANRKTDLRFMIRQANLPEDVKSTIHSVVHQSRLLRMEKASVAEELIAILKMEIGADKAFRSWRRNLVTGRSLPH